MAELESRVEARLRDRVRKAGGMSVKVAPTEKGVPDRLVILGGNIYLVELKAVGGSLSPAQKHWHRRAAQRGVDVVVLTGRDEVDAWVEMYSNELPNGLCGNREDHEPHDVLGSAVGGYHCTAIQQHRIPWALINDKTKEA